MVRPKILYSKRWLEGSVNDRKIEPGLTYLAAFRIGIRYCDRWEDMP